MHITPVNANNSCTTFGTRINGKLSTELCKELFAKKSNLNTRYAAQFERLSKAGSDNSELYIAKYTDGSHNFLLKNPSITTAYEIPLAKAKPGQLLETFLNIKPEDITKAEQTMKSLIAEKINKLIKAAQDRQEVCRIITKAGNDKNIEKAVKNLDDNTVIDLYYTTKK